MDRSEEKRALSTLAIVCLLLFFVFKASWLLCLAVLLLLGIAIDNVLSSWFYKKWMKLVELIGGINARLLLILIYYSFLSPIAIISHRFNNFVIKHYFDKKNDSYFNDINEYREDFAKLW